MQTLQLIGTVLILIVGVITLSITINFSRSKNKNKYRIKMTCRYAFRNGTLNFVVDVKNIGDETIHLADVFVSDNKKFSNYFPVNSSLESGKMNTFESPITINELGNLTAYLKDEIGRSWISEKVSEETIEITKKYYIKISESRDQNTK